MIKLSRFDLFECLEKDNKYNVNNNSSLKGKELFISNKNNAYVTDRVLNMKMIFEDGQICNDWQIGNFKFDLNSNIELDMYLLNPVFFKNYINTSRIIKSLNLEVLVVDCNNTLNLYIAEIEFEDLIISNIKGGFTTDSVIHVVLKDCNDDN